jgi:RNA polymerase sigma-70 factor (ECF subfamily)
MAHPLLDLLFAPSGDPDAQGLDSGDRARHAVRSHPDSGTSHHPDDGDIVARIQAGDVVAFRDLYLDLFRDLWTFARRYTGSSAGAEDIVHDVFFRVWERRATWEVRGSVRAYLFGAVRNRAFHVTEHNAVSRRAQGRMQHDRSGHSEGVRENPLEVMEQQELSDAVAEALAELPERQRAAMLLRLRYGMSYAQVGEALGIAASVAGRLVVKGERRLRERLAGLTENM